ncbi:MAG: hypothetical protein KF862_00020 [Chitinophagaceae bacterium]|nr:hypothetical protein [Chitinophagaceae bacterium]
MKKAGLLMLYLLIGVCANSQDNTQQIALFCKIWGFLKYHHPKVAQGNIDWDKEFLNRIPDVAGLTDKEEISSYYLNWIKSLGAIKKLKNVQGSMPGIFKKNHDLHWANDSVVFNKPLRDTLNYIFENRNQGKNYYAPVKKIVIFKAASPNYSSEPPYKDSIFPSKEMRLLTLSRYWNIINYFYPYRYIIGKNWDSVLTEMIPGFQNVKDTLSYQLLILEMAASINDSHSFITYTPQTFKYFGEKFPVFKYTIIENQAIVTGFYNDSLKQKDSVQYGDIILKLDGRPVSDIILEKEKYFGASNYDCKLRDMTIILLNGNADSAIVTVERDGVINEQIIHRYQFQYLAEGYYKKDTAVSWKKIDDDIGFVNLGSLNAKDISKAMKALWHTKAIIFDVRNYPQGIYRQLSKYLNAEKKHFASVTQPLINFPGMYIRFKKLYTGKNNTRHYKGKIVLLIDEHTQSMAELTVMALQTAPGVITIGNHTAGADGDRREVILPGGYVVSMSSLGFYYPDGRETQRVGIIPDILVKPTIGGVRQKRDEVLEKAIEVIKKGIRQ